jgi:SAM-dependent MidA family methyltransferase
MTPLEQRILQKITQVGGWLAFDEVMQLALYAPGQGYYSGGADPFGDAPVVGSERLGSGSSVGEDRLMGRGDFVTAPMLGPWFAKALWRWSQPLWDAPAAHGAKRPKEPRIREFGGGRGDLARGLLQAAANPTAREAPAPIPLHYEMVELSAPLRARQQAATAGFNSIVWADTLAPAFEGLVIANEVLDAMPVKCFEWQDETTVLEWGVSIVNGQMAWASRSASPELSAAVQCRARAAQERGLPWSVGYRGEWSPYLAPWLGSLFDTMTAGAVLLVDYGHAQSELDHPGRTDGTLCAHYQHRRLDGRAELLHRLGQQDITAHVNFSLVAQAAADAGFEVAGFATQARFLLNAGLLQIAEQVLPAAQTERERVALLQTLQTLLSESEMGEVFKVMLLTKGLAPELQEALMQAGFAEGDRRAGLAF